MLRRSGSASDVGVGSVEVALVAETEFREVFYSQHGAFGQQWVEGEGARWLDPLLPSTPVRGDSLLEWLSGASSHLALSWETLARVLPDVSGALAEPGGCRVVLEVLPLSATRVATLRKHGFSLVRGAADDPATLAEGDAPAVMPGGRQWWHAGKVPVTAPPFQLDLDAAEAAMDSRDRGFPSEPAERRAMRAFLPVPWDPAGGWAPVCRRGWRR